MGAHLLPFFFDQPTNIVDCFSIYALFFCCYFTVQRGGKATSRDEALQNTTSKLFLIVVCILHKPAHTIPRCFAIRVGQESAAACFKDLARVAEEKSRTNQIEQLFL